MKSTALRCFFIAGKVFTMSVTQSTLKPPASLSGSAAAANAAAASFAALTEN